MSSIHLASVLGFIARCERDEKMLAAKQAAAAVGGGAMKTHPVANLFPMLASEELQGLADDIKANGLIEPLTRQGGTLLDGRNRLAACQLVGVEPRWREYEGDNPVAFIVGANLKRRHLNEGQRAALALEIESFCAREAKLRLHLSRGRGVKGEDTGPQVT